MVNNNNDNNSNNNEQCLYSFVIQVIFNSNSNDIYNDKISSHLNNKLTISYTKINRKKKRESTSKNNEIRFMYINLIT